MQYSHTHAHVHTHTHTETQALTSKHMQSFCFKALDSSTFTSRMDGYLCSNFFTTCEGTGSMFFLFCHCIYPCIEDSWPRIPAESNQTMKCVTESITKNNPLQPHLARSVASKSFRTHGFTCFTVFHHLSSV